MKRKVKRNYKDKVLNTQRDEAPDGIKVDVAVLLSDYAKLRALARIKRKSKMEMLQEVLCNGVRRLSGEASAALIVALFYFSIIPANAGIFGGTSDDRPAVRERQIGLLGPAKMADYKASCEMRANLAEDCSALARMISDKEGRYAEKSAELESKYGMTLSQNYNYSKEDLTLYLIVTNGLFGSSPEKPVMRAHRAFVSEEDANGFVAAVSSRSAIAEDVAILRRFLAERRNELKAKEARLLEDFGVFSGKEYRLDEKTGMLFELQPLPTEAELKAQRDAEARAVADAKEHARLKAEAEKKARAEADAREKAEREAMEKAEKERRAAEKKAKAEAEAREKAEREAMEKAEKERRAAEKKAKAEAEARAEAERRAAKDKAEAERRAARARADAEKRAKEEAERLARRNREIAEASARAEKEAEKKRIEAEKRAVEARAKAEREARRKAEKEAEAAREKAKAEAEAREKAEREAKEKAERERRAAEKKAKAEARERAEREAKEKAEKERRAAEKKAKAEAESRAREERRMREKAANEASSW